MHIHHLLRKIACGETINFEQLVKKLPPEQQWSSLFEVELVGKNRHLVKVIDDAKFEALLLSTAPAASRAEAAIHEWISSHDLRCQSAYMLCYPCNKRDDLATRQIATRQIVSHQIATRQISISQTSTHQVSTRQISTVISAKSGIQTPEFKLAKFAILIENQDCFFAWERFMQHFSQQLDVSTCDIFFSAGKQVLNKSMHTFLAQYKRVYCIFDYDLAGLQIFEHLSTRINNDKASTYKPASPKMDFLLPDDIARKHALFKFRCKQLTDLQVAISLAKRLNLPQLAAAFVDTKRFMEQEALLL